MTILHYGAKVGVDPRIESLSAHSRMLYARKHFSRMHRALYFGAVVLRHSLRYLFARGGELGTCRRIAHGAALRTLLRRTPPPHSPWGRFAVYPRELSTSATPLHTP